MNKGISFDPGGNPPRSTRSQGKPAARSVHLLLLITALILSSCASLQSPTLRTGTRVLAAETFLADIAQNVAGQRLHVDSLLSPGIDPHEFQPAPQDAIRIAQSQVFIINGLDYETWLSSSLDAAGGQRIMVVASQGLPAAASAQGAVDPHMWMDPAKAIQYVNNIRDGLSQVDPAGRSIFATNADAYIARLKQLDASIRTQIAQIPPGRRLLVTNHDALGYFALAYGFQVVGAVIPSVTNEASPSAQQMASLIDTVHRTGAPAIFLDVSENQNLARQIASATGAKVVTDLYVETLSAPEGPAPTYIAMLQHDAASIVDALK
ncbi:MAG TPA: zinc ABC transporter substrate-binding protein [Anaerolineales bacterium]